jgi:hypothetical protein
MNPGIAPNGISTIFRCGDGDLLARRLGPPPARGKRQQHDRAAADGERDRWRPLERESCGKPLRANGGRARGRGRLPSGPLKRIAHLPLIGQQPQRRFPTRTSSRSWLLWREYHREYHFERSSQPGGKYAYTALRINSQIHGDRVDLVSAYGGRRTTEHIS